MMKKSTGNRSNCIFENIFPAIVTRLSWNFSLACRSIMLKILVFLFFYCINTDFEKIPSQKGNSADKIELSPDRWDDFFSEKYFLISVGCQSVINKYLTLGHIKIILVYRILW